MKTRNAGSVVSFISILFTVLLLAGAPLILHATDGVPGGVYELLTSPNVATPLTNWVVLDSGNLDWLGNQNISVPINPAIPRRFFTVRVP